MNIDYKNYGNLKDGSSADYITMDNGFVQLGLCNYGATICSIKIPDRNGVSGEIVLGLDSLDEYQKEHPYMGTVVGPVANRISNSSFKIADTLYKLDSNEPPNHLHGGINAFDRQIWSWKSIEENDSLIVRMSRDFADGKNGYPGNRTCTIDFILYKTNVIDIVYKCKSDKDTPINLTHHEYFNLADGGASTVKDHELQIFANAYTPVNNKNCVTGEIRKVDDSVFDFRQMKILRDALEINDSFDHNFVLDKEKGQLSKAAVLRHNGKGRQVEIWTTQECLQLYTAQHLDGSFGRGNTKYKPFHGICLETQSFPDAVNQPQFPSVLLKAYDTYHHICRYSFSNF